MDSHVPDSLSGKWMQFMRCGNFEEALQISDAVLADRAGRSCYHLPRHFQYFWDGTSLEGKRVLVRCYHGLGDTIQFIRYMPLLQSLAKEVTVLAPTALLPLLRSVPGISHLIPLHDSGHSGADYEVEVEVMELLHVFRTSLATIPSHIPYLHVDSMPLSQGENQFSVGLVWKAGDWDTHRSIPFPLLAPIGAVEGVNLYILQANAKEAGWQPGFGINPGEFSLYEYARVLKGLDLLITVDSMPGHLAGALGIPVWNLLHAAADWRWMENREDSPWYPTMKLFRQQNPGDWTSVIERVVVELERIPKLPQQDSKSKV